MRLLLDTHAFLWYVTNDRRLPRYAADAIRDKNNEVYLSAVSVWEALIKHQTRKLELPTPADEYIDSQRMAHRIADLDLHVGAVARLLSLPSFHRDPFDRMLVCQALHHGLTLVTTDELLHHYPVAILSPA